MKPSCIILAGPNGSGKSSIYEKLQPPGHFINADNIASSLDPSLPANIRRVQAGRATVSLIDQMISNKDSFVFETTLSSRHSIDTMQKAKRAGFHVGLIYVILHRAEQNIERVRFRVKSGGHDIPTVDIIRRYEKSLDNLPKAVALSDEGVVIDNSERKPLFLAEFRRDGQVTHTHIATDGETELHMRLNTIITNA